MNRQNDVNVQKTTVKLAKMGMLIGISIILVVLIHVPIIPAAPYLEYDPADIPIFIGTFAFGPLAGLILTIIVSIIQGVTVSAGSQIWGIIMHIMATGSFAIVAGLIYKVKKTRKGAAIAILIGILVMIAVMCIANIIITPIYTGMPRKAVMALIPTAILPFNLIKAGINGVVTFILYKKISKFLHNSRTGTGLILKNLRETELLGEKIADRLKKGTVIALIGELGTGKTAMTKAIAKGLGITENVNSPTFTLVQEYYSGKLPFFHFDVYRVDAIDELDVIDFNEYFYSDGICVVEWADLIEEELPDEAIRVFIEYAKEEDSRIIKIEDPAAILGDMKI